MLRNLVTIALALNTIANAELSTVENNIENVEIIENDETDHALVGGTKWVNGMNMPWKSCGNDWGVDYNHNSWADLFQRYHSADANTVRQWIHFDGNKSISLFDMHGYFKPLSTKFLQDAEDNLKLYKDNKMQAIFTLFSFECVNNDNCEHMITQKASSDAYIKNGLKPLLDLFKKYRNQIYAIELFNEPEWMITGGEGVHRQISLK